MTASKWEVMDSCVFCESVRGKVETSILYEDVTLAAFMDIRPVNSGHMLIVPKVHVAYLNDLDEDVGAQLFRVAMRFDRALRNSGFRCEGVNMFLADGEAAGQEIFHVHSHVFPRFVGDGFGLKFAPHCGLKPSRPSLNAIAVRIRAAMAA